MQYEFNVKGKPTENYVASSKDRYQHGRKDKMNILAVIPARSGSKRVPGKNVRSLGGRPLLLWTVDAALEAKQRLSAGINGEKVTFDICLSTDSEDYVKIALEHVYKDTAGQPVIEGGRLPIVRRGGELAKDCDTALVVRHAADVMEKGFYPSPIEDTLFPRRIIYDAFMTLQPTSPFRTWKDITDCVNLYAQAPQTSQFAHDCIFTARPVAEFPQWMFTHGQFARSYLGIPTRYLSGIIAQDLPELYLPNGAVYVSSRALIMAERPRIYGDRCGMVVMDKLRSIDIEEEGDFAYAEWLLQNKKVNLE